MFFDFQRSASGFVSVRVWFLLPFHAEHSTPGLTITESFAVRPQSLTSGAALFIWVWVCSFVVVFYENMCAKWKEKDVKFVFLPVSLFADLADGWFLRKEAVIVNEDLCNATWQLFDSDIFRLPVMLLRSGFVFRRSIGDCVSLIARPMERRMLDWLALPCLIKSRRITQFYQWGKRSQRLHSFLIFTDAAVFGVFLLLFCFLWLFGAVVVGLSVSHRSTLKPTRPPSACQNQRGCLTCVFSLERCRMKNTVLKTPGSLRKMSTSSSVWNEKRGKRDNFHNLLIWWHWKLIPRNSEGEKNSKVPPQLLSKPCTAVLCCVVLCACVCVCLRMCVCTVV